MATRFLAQRILTGQWLDLNLPLTQVNTLLELSGPGFISGTLTPELRYARAADGLKIIEEWATALYAVEGNQIRCGGIVTSAIPQNGRLQVTAPGFTVYPSGQPITSAYTPEDWEDPQQVYRNLWEKVQATDDSFLGVEVDFEPSYMILGDGAGPYNFNEAEYRDFGQELENISSSAPFDYVERHEFVGTTYDQVRHSVNLGFPRHGSRRHDLRFAQDENVTDFGALTPDGEQFSNDVLYLGQGEGYAQVKHRTTRPDGRLRRTVAVTNKRITEGLVQRYAERELDARSLEPDVTSLTIKDHPHARITAIHLGDDILFEYNQQHVGRRQVWLRVIAIEESTDAPDKATLRTMRSDRFSYASATNPNEESEPFLVTI